MDIKLIDNVKFKIGMKVYMHEDIDIFGEDISQPVT